MFSNSLARKMILACALAWPYHGAFAESDCKRALTQHSVCERANSFAGDLMRSRHLVGTSVVQDVRTGALVISASSQPSKLDVSTQVLPLSLSKVFLAASWWDHKQPDLKFESSHGLENASNPAFRKWVNVREMLVGGSDSAGEQVAVALRKEVGTRAVLADLDRYGFNPGN